MAHSALAHGTTLFENLYPAISQILHTLCDKHFINLNELHARDLLIPPNHHSEGPYLDEHQHVRIYINNPFHSLSYGSRILIIDDIYNLVSAAHPFEQKYIAKQSTEHLHTEALYSHYAFAQSLHLLAHLYQDKTYYRGMRLKESFEYIHHIAISLSNIMHGMRDATTHFASLQEKLIRLMNHCIKALSAMNVFTQAHPDEARVEHMGPQHSLLKKLIEASETLPILDNLIQLPFSTHVH
jgi:hypothetical protein